MLSLEEALSALDEIIASGSINLEALRLLADEVSVVDSKATAEAATHLYSRVGSVCNILDINDSALRLIDRTPLADFLSSNKFNIALKDAIKNEKPGIRSEELKLFVREYKFGISTEGTTGFWADASLRFMKAEETKGVVVVHMGAGAEGRTMVNVELPVILGNPDEMSIDFRPTEFVSPEERARVINKLAESLMTEEERGAFRNIMADFSSLTPVETGEYAFRTYLQYSGKSFQEFTAFDNIVLSFAEKSPLGKINPADAEVFSNWFAANSSKLAKMGKAAESLSTIATAVYIGYEVFSTVPRAIEAYENGEAGEAVGIVAGKATEVATVLILGGALTSELAAVLVPACAVAAGPFAPVGAVVGGIVSAVAGFGISVWVGAGLEEIVKSFIADAVNSVIEFVNSGFIEDFLNTIDQAAGNFINTVTNKIAEAASSVYHTTVSAVQSGARAAENFISNVVNRISETASSVYHTTVSAVQSGAQAAGNFISNVVNQAVTTVNNLYNTVTSKIHDAKESFADFVNKIKQDIQDFDITNEDELKVLSSNCFSWYKGCPVIRWAPSTGRSFSFGALFISPDEQIIVDPNTGNPILDRNKINTVRHEYGHTAQFRELGPIVYFLYYGIPSMTSTGDMLKKYKQIFGISDYYDLPWEIRADVEGGVDFHDGRIRDFTTEEAKRAIEQGKAYQKFIESIPVNRWVLLPLHFASVSATRFMSQATKGFVNYAVTRVTETADYVVGTVRSTAQAVDSFINHVVHLAANTTKNIYNSLISEVQAMKESMISWTNNLSEAAISGINLGTALFTNQYGGVSGMTASTSGSRIAVNIKDLKKLKKSAEDLLNEICAAKHTNAIAQARSEAKRALSQYSQSYVRSDANAVLRACDELEIARNRACADLRTEIYGLGKVIDGYLNLESSFA